MSRVSPSKPCQKGENFLPGCVLFRGAKNPVVQFFMKTFSSLCAFMLLSNTVALCQAQQATSVPPPTPYTVISRDANSRVWERTTYEVTPSGQIISHKQHYTELASGLCYKQNGQWVDSQEQINILPDGTAAATNGQYQAYFPGDIYDGVIRLVTSDGLKLQSRPIGLSYDDGTNTILIAELTNSVGQLIGDNQVIYTNAFAGLSADLLYTYRKSGFEQDVVFREQPPTPEEYGLSSANARLQLLTEFFNSPTPLESVSAMSPPEGLKDTTLSFGSMKMIHGRAFLTGGTSPQHNLHKTSVYKSWTAVDGRTLLVEQLPYSSISSQLSTLPISSAAAANPGNASMRKSPLPVLPPPRLVKAATNSMELAKVDLLKKTGVVLDYITVNSTQTNYTFRGDTTYDVDGDFYLYGTTILEGGAVLKYNVNGIVEIDENGTLDCLTAPYRPAIFTSTNDNSVGATISGSSGAPNFNDVSWYYLAFDGPNATVHDLRFCYGWQAITENGGNTTFTVRDCQFYNILVPIYAAQIYLYNDLMGYSADEASEIQAYQLPEIWIEGSGLVAENVTSDSGYAFINADQPDEVIALTNCLITSQILTNLDNAATLLTNDVAYVPLPTEPVYQIIGGGNYYLTNGSSYRSCGTANIDPTLLNDLAQKTTWPPIVYDATNISSLGALSLVVPRDISSSPDLGYHYDPLDYAFGGCDLSSNLTVATGTAVGWFEDYGSYSGEPYSISLETGANLSFNGNVTQPCFFPNYAMVQEGGNGNWTTFGWMGAIMFNGSGSSPTPQISANFTKWTDPSLIDNFFRDAPANGQGYFRNCEFYDGGMSAYDMQALSFTNCLFFRDVLAFWDQNTALNFTNINCTYYNGGLGLVRSSGQSSSFWQIENSSFDGTALGFSDNDGGSTNNTLFDYNAYNTNNLSWQTYTEFSPYLAVGGKLEDVGVHDVMVTNYDWQMSWFGNFYLPTNSLLIQKGSTNANLLGLYHFTTQTNQIPETNSIVDIGYHYVATDTNGIPLDSNGDGIPDYLEDANGDGIYDTGDLAAWNVIPNDTIPSAWYTLFGLNPNNPSVGIQDPDWDGLLSQQEYLYGTDPIVSEGFAIWVGTPNGTSGIP